MGHDRDSSISPGPVLNEEAAATYVAMSPAFLRSRRLRGAGPPFLRLGRAVRYRTSDLDKWLLARRVNF